jgi:tryptophan-rich sensory protein
MKHLGMAATLAGMHHKPIRSLAAWLALVTAVAVLGGFASRDAGAFYGQLVQPAWAPPGWLFGPVWTTLYLMMGVAAWRVWRAPGRHTTAMALFGAQLAANALWSWLFFAWHRGGLAFADILLLDALVVATIVQFARIDRLAAWLLVPYLAWIAFATGLNWAVWRANPGLLG